MRPRSREAEPTGRTYTVVIPGSPHSPNGGVLAGLEAAAAALPGGGEQRPGQQRMAEAVAEAVEQGGHLVVAAGTGIGKSLAYLVPAVLSGLRTVVATATKALQDQLADKDLPMLAAGLGADFDYAVLKGRSNYLCRQRLDEAESPGRLLLEGIDDRLPADVAADLRRFADWTGTGDRDDPAVNVDDRTWGLVSVSSEECPGAARCPQGEHCFAERARRRAARARVVVVNHHLYALDVLTGGQVLGPHHLAVIDEVHQFESIFSQVAGCSVTPGRFAALGWAVRAGLSEPGSADALHRTADRLRGRLGPLAGLRLRAGPGEELQGVLDAAAEHLAALSVSLQAAAEAAGSPAAEARALRALGAAGALLGDIAMVRDPDEDHILWVDGRTAGGRGHNPALKVTPVRIDGILAEELWPRRAAVLTSATVPLDLTGKLGLPAGTEELDVGSPFDYEANALLYCPDLPDPRRDDRGPHWEELATLMGAAGGRTLALFTSHRAMREAAEHCRSASAAPILVQGEASKSALVAEFAASQETSLFATMSFWQGVDVAGPSCSLVVIDRLPFSRPDDPVLQARRELAAQDGSDPFNAVDLPRAATLLAQGAGRLIRSTGDRGVVAVLDRRLATAGYRSKLLGALPPMPRTRSRQAAVDFLRSLRPEPPG